MTSIVTTKWGDTTEWEYERAYPGCPYMTKFYIANKDGICSHPKAIYIFCGTMHQIGGYSKCPLDAGKHLKVH